jgi:hypothetical protein
MPDLILTGIEDGKKIQAIKGLRLLSSLGPMQPFLLKQAKDIIDLVDTGEEYIYGDVENSERIRRLLCDHSISFRFEAQEGIKVTVEDLQTGERETNIIQDDYICVTAGDCYVSHTQIYPRTGTHQLTIKRHNA